jgi:hypothetical protein
MRHPEFWLKPEFKMTHIIYYNIVSMMFSSVTPSASAL